MTASHWFRYGPDRSTSRHQASAKRHRSPPDGSSSHLEHTYKRQDVAAAAALFPIYFWLTTGQGREKHSAPRWSPRVHRVPITSLPADASMGVPLIHGVSKPSSSAGECIALLRVNHYRCYRGVVMQDDPNYLSLRLKTVDTAPVLIIISCNGPGRRYHTACTLLSCSAHTLSGAIPSAWLGAHRRAGSLRPRSSSQPKDQNI